LSELNQLDHSETITVKSVTNGVSYAALFKMLMGVVVAVGASSTTAVSCVAKSLYDGMLDRFAATDANTLKIANEFKNDLGELGDRMTAQANTQADINRQVQANQMNIAVLQTAFMASNEQRARIEKTLEKIESKVNQ
jgi:septal ring factor EnvC (AmiA/AmiB activator)